MAPFSSLCAANSKWASSAAAAAASCFFLFASLQPPLSTARVGRGGSFMKISCCCSAASAPLLIVIAVALNSYTLLYSRAAIGSSWEIHAEPCSCQEKAAQFFPATLKVTCRSLSLLLFPLPFFISTWCLNASPMVFFDEMLLRIVFAEFLDFLTEFDSFEWNAKIRRICKKIDLVWLSSVMYFWRKDELKVGKTEIKMYIFTYFVSILQCNYNFLRPFFKLHFNK